MNPPLGFFRKHRLEALSDGIFAITMTLLVLEFKIPEAKQVTEIGLWAALHEQRIEFLCYMLTFAITARYWILQHIVFELVEHVHKQAVVFTFMFLSMISLLPFTTPLMARYGSNHVALAIYCTNLTGVGAALLAKLEFLRRADHLPETPMLHGLRWKLWTLTIAMALGGTMSFIVPSKFAFFPSVFVLILGQKIAHRGMDAATAAAVE